jgi:hypothetical protein
MQKYRIFDKELKIYGYFPNEEGKVSIDDFRCFTNVYEMSHILTNPERYVVECFSGWMDKEGKEVYEGDIVGIPYVDPMGRVHPDDIEEKSTVVFSKGVFGVDIRNEMTPLILWGQVSEEIYIANYGYKKIYSDKLYLTKLDDTNRL